MQLHYLYINKYKFGIILTDADKKHSERYIAQVLYRSRASRSWQNKICTFPKIATEH